jgi:hypothetical protein
VTPRERANAPATPEFRERLRALDEAREALRRASDDEFDARADELSIAAALLVRAFSEHMGWATPVN